MIGGWGRCEGVGVGVEVGVGVVVVGWAGNQRGEAGEKRCGN